jgi:hypothetical protein
VQGALVIWCLEGILADTALQSGFPYTLLCTEPDHVSYHWMPVLSLHSGTAVYVCSCYCCHVVPCLCPGWHCYIKPLCVHCCSCLYTYLVSCLNVVVLCLCNCMYFLCLVFFYLLLSTLRFLWGDLHACLSWVFVACFDSTRKVVSNGCARTACNVLY